MARMESQRMMADVPGVFVVFLIGMQINASWRIDRWWPAFSAMPKMLRELSAKPEFALLGYRGRWGGRNVELIQ